MFVCVSTRPNGRNLPDLRPLPIRTCEYAGLRPLDCATAAFAGDCRLCPRQSRACRRAFLAIGRRNDGTCLVFGFFLLCVGPIFWRILVCSSKVLTRSGAERVGLASDTQISTQTAPSLPPKRPRLNLSMTNGVHEKRRIGIVLLVFMTFAFCKSAEAHSGGTNAAGCHAGTKPYHCHAGGEESPRKKGSGT